MTTKTKQEVQLVRTTDARYKVFKEKLKKLGYAKAEAARVRKVMEVTADFGMMSNAGNKKVARAVSQSKNEKELRAKLDKISKMGGGKYSEAGDEDVIDMAINALGSGAKGMQLRPDAQVIVQLGGIEDRKKDGEVRTDDMKKTKVKHKDAAAVRSALLGLKPAERDKYMRPLQKDQKSFKKTFNFILKQIKQFT
jgi:hypothetical protein